MTTRKKIHPASVGAILLFIGACDGSSSSGEAVAPTIRPGTATIVLNNAGVAAVSLEVVGPSISNFAKGSGSGLLWENRRGDTLDILAFGLTTGDLASFSVANVESAGDYRLRVHEAADAQGALVGAGGSVGLKFSAHP